MAQHTRWLVTYYNGNDRFAAIVNDLNFGMPFGADDRLEAVLRREEDPDFQVDAISRLPDDDFVPEVYIDGSEVELRTVDLP